MKLGAENRVKLAIMFMLAITAAFMVGRRWSLSPASDTGVASAPRARERVDSRPRNSIGVELLTLDETAEYRGGSRNIFRKLEHSSRRLPEPPPSPPTEQRHQVVMPSIGLKFFGFASRIGHAVRVFLTEGEEVFIAGEGEIVNRRYRVVRIGPSWLEIEDVLTNHSENIPLIQG